MATIPSPSWRVLLDSIYKLGIGAEVGTEARASLAVDFLVEIGLVENDSGMYWEASLTADGINLFRSRFVLNDEATADKIMAEALLRNPIASLLVQVFNGRGAIAKSQVWNLLCHHDLMSHEESIAMLGRLFALLNRFGVIKYDKKNGRITIEHEPTDIPSLPQYFVSPTTPYSNVNNLRKIIKDSKGAIYWLDKHFRKEGLEFIIDVASGQAVHTITIISGAENATQSARSDYERTKQELSYRGINLEWRICTDKNFLGKWHDRWFLADNHAYNIPPVLSIIRGQQAQMLKIDDRPSVQEFTNNSNPLF